MSRSYSIAQARDHLARLVHRAEQGAPVELTRHGKPVAILLSKKAYEDLNGRRLGLWDALELFRREADLGPLAEDPDPFDQIRDRAPGRKVRL